jgi:hypothetical protein
MSLKVFVVVATVGRADVTRRTVDRLADQSRLPDGILVVPVGEADIAGLETARGDPRVVFGERGLCRQRNKSLDVLAGQADVIVFFDDDFVAGPDYIAQVAELFASRPEIVGATGHVIADGVNNNGYDFDEAVALIEAAPPLALHERPIEALYGCNMCIRLAAAEGLRFDEALPLYGWQEDVDFTYQLGRRGQLVKTSRMSGVHMGSKAGRTPGKRLGYSQISNPVHLLRKRTMPRRMAVTLMLKNFAANLVKSPRPEPHIDRLGRLTGNLLALRDLALGRLDPRRILDLA